MGPTWNRFSRRVRTLISWPTWGSPVIYSSRVSVQSQVLTLLSGSTVQCVDVDISVSDLERSDGLPDLLGENKPSSAGGAAGGSGGGGGGGVRGSCPSRSVQEMFPDSGPVVSPRQRAARLMIQCPLLSITALARDRLRPGGGRVPELRPVTVEWNHLVVGGRPGLRRRQRRPGRTAKIASYVNILRTCA